MVLLQKTNSRELAAHAIKSNEQTAIKKKTKGEALANVSQLTCSSHELQPQENKYNSISMIPFSQKHVPEYVCACCDQLWFKFSVVKCDPNKYKACSPDIVESCLD